MSKRLVVIDGKSVFYRGYYAMPNLSTKDGRPTGGVYGFATMALEVVRKLKPDYVTVAWDKRHTNIRARLKLYPDYKAGRKPAPEDFYDQAELLFELLASLGWPMYEADDYEADDLMATFAHQAKARGIETYLVTSDLDVLQLVDPHTHIYTLKKGVSSIEHFDEESFRAKYGVGAHQWVDVKALKGDSSDNIPGAAGIGEKTALALIDKYDSVDGVYDHLDELKPAVRTKLEASRDMVYLSRKLVTLFTDAPIKLDFKKAKLDNGVGPEFLTMLRKLEFKSLLRQAEASLPKEDAAIAEQALKTLEPAKEVEPQPLKDEPLVVALGKGDEIWVSSRPGEFYRLPLDGADKVFSKRLIGHNLKQLFRICLKQGFACEGQVEHDTRVGAFLLNSLERSRELTDLLDQPVDTGDPGETIAAIWQAYQEQKVRFEDVPKLSRLARQIEFPSIWLLAKVEHRGVLLDSQYLIDMSKDFDKKIGALQRRVWALAGHEFNIGSPAQLGVVLYQNLGLPTSGKKGKSGAHSTGAAELNRLAPLHPIAQAVLDYRELTKLKSTYIDTLPKQVDDDGRVRTIFALDISASGRLSSHDPNLQNIPTRTEAGHAIRRAFVPAEGNMLISADYNQFELRLAAALSGDEQLIRDFNQGLDVHSKTASELYGVAIDKVDKEMRRHAKVINFGILYGMGPHALSVAAGMSFADAKMFIEKYFELRAPIRQFIDKTLEQARELGFVETLFGRRRPTPDVRSSNFAVREAAKRAAANMPIQGTEADLMKLAMIKLEEKIEGLGEQILQIHDSILVETPKENTEKVAKIMQDTMENIHPNLAVKLKVDTKIGTSWGDL